MNFPQKTETKVWVEGQTDDGHTYYYNTITGGRTTSRYNSFCNMDQSELFTNIFPRSGKTDYWIVI